jgi:hypothetical protein
MMRELIFWCVFVPMCAALCCVMGAMELNGIEI